MSRVLLVSGSDRSREDLTREITESGWPCVGAADAAQARALLQGEEFALIIADTPLPETGALLREVLDGTASMVLLLARAGFAQADIDRLEARGAGAAEAAEQGAVPADGAAGHGRAAAAAGNKNRKRGFTPQN